MKKHPNILIIHGDGRKSGKTTLACRLISQFQDNGVIAIKICPHFHITEGLEMLASEQRVFEIYRENSVEGEKDSSRMLAAGAALVLYVQCSDKGLEAAWKELETMLPPDRPVIAESGGLGRLIRPGLAVLVAGSEQNKPVSGTYDVKTSLTEMKENMPALTFADGKWYCA
jgi:hypothetical protein